MRKVTLNLGQGCNRWMSWVESQTFYPGWNCGVRDQSALALLFCMRTALFSLLYILVPGEELMSAVLIGVKYDLIYLPITWIFRSVLPLA